MNEENKDGVTIELRWHDLRTELPPDDGCVVLFPQISDVGILYSTSSIYTASNSEFVRMNALRNGYTHWFPIPKHPTESEIRSKIEKLYAHEHDSDYEFYKGFQRAVENIVNTLKEIVPDRPEVARSIESIFSNKDEKEVSNGQREVE